MERSTVEAARERVETAWRFAYRGLTLADVEIAAGPGYWRIKEPCGGRGACSSPMHQFFGCDGPTQHTVTFVDPPARDERGRFLSPYRTWRILAAQSPNPKSPQRQEASRD